MEYLLAPIFDIGFGGLIGFLLGFAAKKMLKVLAFLAGLGLLVLVYFEYKSIIAVRYETLEVAIRFLYETLSSLCSKTLTALPLAGSFIIGFGIGMKYG